MLSLLSSVEFIQFGFTKPHAIRVGESFVPDSDQTVARRGLKRVLIRAQNIFMPKNTSCITLNLFNSLIVSGRYPENPAI